MHAASTLQQQQQWQRERDNATRIMLAPLRSNTSEHWKRQRRQRRRPPSHATGGGGECHRCRCRSSSHTHTHPRTQLCGVLSQFSPPKQRRRATATGSARARATGSQSERRVRWTSLLYRISSGSSLTGATFITVRAKQKKAKTKWKYRPLITSYFHASRARCDGGVVFGFGNAHLFCLAACLVCLYSSTRRSAIHTIVTNTLEKQTEYNGLTHIRR